MSAAMPFIQQRLESVQKTIEDDIFAWQTGRKHPNLGFSGTLVDQYWGPYLQGNVRTILDAAFAAYPEVIQGTSISATEAARDAGYAADSTFQAVLMRMRHADAGMRGDGITRAAERDVTEFRDRFQADIERRTQDEIAMAAARKFDFVRLPLTKEHDFRWYLAHCSFAMKLALVSAAFGLVSFGFGARWAYEFLNRASNTSPQNIPTLQPIQQTTGTPTTK
jgi:hypothetical protein